MAELTREIWIDASPGEVYPYLVQADLATAWMGDQSWHDPRPGGVFRLDIRGHVASGEFVELDPPRRVVFTWGWEGDDQIQAPGSTTVQFDLEPRAGGTQLRLRHSGLTDEGVVAHGEGWERFLPELAKVAA
jgi:uncharacterized protein YndB with AHSA1/START domain